MALYASPSAIGPRLSKLVELERERDTTGIDADDQLEAIAGDLGELESRLAELDYLLTGTACYGLTWPDRLDRVRRLVEQRTSSDGR